MHIVLPLALLLFLLRASRGVTDTIKKYEQRGVAGEGDSRSTSGYARGLQD